MAETGSAVQSTKAALTADVPWGIFGIIFGVILVGFLIWYMFNRNGPVD